MSVRCWGTVLIVSYCTRFVDVDVCQATPSMYSAETEEARNRHLLATCHVLRLSNEATDHSTMGIALQHVMRVL